MKNEWIKNIYVTVSVIGFIVLALYICWLPEKKFQERQNTFRDTLMLRHGFCNVDIIEQPRPMVVRGISYIDWIITLHGLIETREKSSAFARCFANNVACYGHGLTDSVTIVYADDRAIIRRFAFANSDLGE